MELKEIEKQIQLIFGCNSRDAGIVTIFIEQYGKEQYNQALDIALEIFEECEYAEDVINNINNLKKQ